MHETFTRIFVNEYESMYTSGTRVSPFHRNKALSISFSPLTILDNSPTRATVNVCAVNVCWAAASVRVAFGKVTVNAVVHKTLFNIESLAGSCCDKYLVGHSQNIYHDKYAEHYCTTNLWALTRSAGNVQANDYQLGSSFYLIRCWLYRLFGVENN